MCVIMHVTFLAAVSKRAHENIILFEKYHTVRENFACLVLSIFATLAVVNSGLTVAVPSEVLTQSGKTPPSFFRRPPHARTLSPPTSSTSWLVVDKVSLACALEPSFPKRIATGSYIA